MSNKNYTKITAAYLNEQIGKLVEEDNTNPGAWNYFVLCTTTDLKQDYNVTMEYLSEISKEQFDFICEGMEEVVYHFQKTEMVDLIENLYHKFYMDKETNFYKNNVAPLRNCIKNK